MAVNNNDIIYDEDDYLHVGALIMDYLRFLRRTWIILFLFLGIAAGSVVISRNITFTPAYSSQVFYSLTRTTDTVIDAAVAVRVANGVSTITSTSDFRSELQNELLKQFGDATVSGSYSFYGVTVPDANLFYVVCNCTDPEYANQLIQAFQVVFPGWVSKANGKTVLTVTDQVFSNGAMVNSMPIAKRLLYALIAAFGCWFLIATIRIFAIQKIHGEDDMYRIVDSKCFGILPNVDKKKRDKSTKETLLISNEHIDGGYLQAVRSLGARVEDYLEEQQKQILMVSSTLEDEGKTLLVMNLAMLLQRHGKRVLVIDGDMRNSTLSDLLDCDEKTQGLSDCLNGNCNTKVLIKKKQGIYYIPSGNTWNEQDPILKLKRMTSLVNSLRGLVDVILIDTPAAGQHGEAILFSETADAVLYLVRGDYAEIRDIRKSIEPFAQNRKLIGYVLNRVNSTVYGYGYKYGYGAAYAKYRNYGSYSSRYGAYGSSYGKYNMELAMEEQENHADDDSSK